MAFFVEVFYYVCKTFFDQQIFYVTRLPISLFSNQLSYLWTNEKMTPGVSVIYNTLDV